MSRATRVSAFPRPLSDLVVYMTLVWHPALQRDQPKPHPPSLNPYCHLLSFPSCRSCSRIQYSPMTAFEISMLNERDYGVKNAQQFSTARQVSVPSGGTTFASLIYLTPPRSTTLSRLHTQPLLSVVLVRFLLLSSTYMRQLTDPRTLSRQVEAPSLAVTLVARRAYPVHIHCW